MARHAEGSLPKLTPEIIECIKVALASGAYAETAAAAAGVSKDTLYRWLRGARQTHATPLLLELSDAVRKAMAQAELRDLQVVQVAANEGDWKAAAWRLERRNPRRWGTSAEGEDLDEVAKTDVERLMTDWPLT